MKITFLGTSSGMPTLQRNVTAAALSPAQGKRWYLIDCGEATQHQLLRTALSMLHLRAVFITHVHGDHCYGLPGLLASAATVGRTEPLDIIAPTGIREFIEAVCRHTLLALPYRLRFHATEDLQTFTAEDFAVSSLAISHRVPSYAYVFDEHPSAGRLNVEKLEASGLPRGRLWGQLQRGEDVRLEDGRLLRAKEYLLPVKSRRVIIGGDNDTPSLLTAAAARADLLVHEATYTAAVANDVEPGPQHSSAESVAAFAQKIKIPNLILTHFSKRYHQSPQSNLDELEQEAAAHYKGNLFLANDFDVFTVQQDGSVARTSPTTAR